jgi:DNA helicase-2/ATP-dependent DNA helicase PcrA
VVDPAAGDAAVRVLTGPRWRLGARDLTALWRRAGALIERPGGAPASPDEIVTQAGPDADTACLADAVCDPGPSDAYSIVGYRRICALAEELTALRGLLEHPVADLVAEIRRVVGVDVEVRALAGGTEQLDAFADVVDNYAQHDRGADGGVRGLLAFLDAAESVENGLAPAEVATGSTAANRVQVLTVHAAKGLEWQIVAVPHLSGRIFPSTASTRTWLTDPGELPPLLRGDRASLGPHGVPVLDTSAVTNRKQLSEKISEHRDQLASRRIDEERRLLYVAITRAEDTLLVSGHHWGATELKPRGPSRFLCEIRDIIEASAAEGRPCGDVDQWAPEPSDGERNPLRENAIQALWPVASAFRPPSDVQRGAGMVTAAIAALETEPQPACSPDRHGWAAEVDALLAERAVAAASPEATLPAQLSVSSLV